MLIYGRDLTGVNCGELYMSYKSIFQDLRDAVDIVHANVSSRLMSNAKYAVAYRNSSPIL